MKSSFAFAAAALLLSAAPAQALKVTNLDHVPHAVTYEVVGTVHARTLAPGETVNWVGLPDGRLSLASSPAPKHGDVVNAQGILSGVIGNGRDQGIPAYGRDDYAIWPGGKLMLQRRMKDYGHR